MFCQGTFLSYPQILYFVNLSTVNKFQFILYNLIYFCLLTGVILDTYCVQVPACDALFYFVPAFSDSKNFKFTCFLVGFYIQIILNLLKYTLLSEICWHALPF